MQLRRSYRPSVDSRDVDRKHRPEDEILSRMGFQSREVYQQRRGEQVSQLPIPRALQTGLDSAPGATWECLVPTLRRSSSRRPGCMYRGCRQALSSVAPESKTDLPPMSAD